MLWGKQYYCFDLDRWLEEHEANPLRGQQSHGVRNRQWYHMVNDDILSMSLVLDGMRRSGRRDPVF